MFREANNRVKRLVQENIGTLEVELDDWNYCGVVMEKREME